MNELIRTNCIQSTHRLKLPKHLNCLFVLLLAAIIITISHTSITLGARTRLRNKLDVRFNFDCPSNISPDETKPAKNLFQVTSSNPQSPEKTNFILSNINGPPMVIMTSSAHNSSLHVDCDVIFKNAPPNNTNNAFYFNEIQDKSIGLLLEDITIFNDTDGSGLLHKDQTTYSVDWSIVNWDLASRTTYLKDDFLKITLRMRPSSLYKNTGGNIQIKLAIPRDIKADRQKEVPHLKLGNQSMSVVVIVDNLQPDKEFSRPHLSMTFLVAVQSPTKAVSLEKERDSIISDEYTPGIFKIKSYQFASTQVAPTSDPSPDNMAPLSSSSENLGFFYWKEVAYTDRRKIISRTIDVFDFSSENEVLPNISVPFHQFFTHRYEDKNTPLYQFYRIKFVYGKGDSVYSTTNFMDFSFVFGLGTAPREQMFSFFVKIIIFVCFCLPILVTLAGLVHLMLRRFRRNGDEELLLAAES